MSLQDILGQLPLLKSYTHILLCFSLPDTQRDPVIEALESATKRLLTSFPFLAGNVVHRDIQPGHSGTFTVEDFTDKDITNEKLAQILHIKDLSDILPPYTALSAARAPPSMLPGSLVAPPRPAFPRVYPESTAPVLEIQVSLLQGGLLLTLAAQHNVIDATGIFYIATCLSRFMNDHPDPIPHADLVVANCDRRKLIPLLRDHEPLPTDLDLFTLPPPPRLSPEVLKEYTWSMIHFSLENVAAIHAEANRRPEEFVEGITSVSVNDAITAFCWQRVTIVRAALHNNASTNPTPGEGEGAVGRGGEQTTQLTRAADLRRAMSLSPAYMGHMVRTANLRLPVATVINSSLSYLSSRLRDCVKRHTTPSSITAYATLLSRTRDKGKILYAGGFNPVWDFSCSSVVHMSVPEFGRGLGKVDFVRRPDFGALPGGMYVGGSSSAGGGDGKEGGGIDAVVCLKRADIGGLLRDKEWSRKVEHVA
ncbi:hypothetical protein BDV12DRAFT_196189 [Aspergillus spectabilis]